MYLDLKLDDSVSSVARRELFLAECRDHLAECRDHLAAARDILAALRALPPETVADVREAAERVRHAPLFNSRHTAQANADRARRLSALADILDTLTETTR